MKDNHVARAALLDQADRVADAIESTKGQARCEAHGAIANGICMLLRLEASSVRIDMERDRDGGSLKRRITALVMSWLITGIVSASILVLLASCVVGFQWQAILAKLLP